MEMFEFYLDKPIHDFMFRLQRAGGEIYFSPKHVCIASHFLDESGDHRPVHNAYLKDAPYFNKVYSIPSLFRNRIKLDFNNWKLSQPVWRDRFTNGIPKTYKDLCIVEGYDLKSIENMKKQLQELLNCELK